MANRDDWELELEAAKKLRHTGFDALLILPDEKDRAIKEQARASVPVVQDLEEALLYLRARPRGEGDDGVAWDKICLLYTSDAADE